MSLYFLASIRLHLWITWWEMRDIFSRSISSKAQLQIRCRVGHVYLLLHVQRRPTLSKLELLQGAKFVRVEQQNAFCDFTTEFYSETKCILLGQSVSRWVKIFAHSWITFVNLELNRDLIFSWVYTSIGSWTLTYKRRLAFTV